MSLELAKFSKSILVGAALCAVLSGPAVVAAHSESAQRAKKVKKARPCHHQGDKQQDRDSKHPGQPSSEPSVAVISSPSVTKSAEGKGHSDPSAQFLCSTHRLSTQDWSTACPAWRGAKPTALHEPVYRAHAPPIGLEVF